MECTNVPWASIVINKPMEVYGTTKYVYTKLLLRIEHILYDQYNHRQAIALVVLLLHLSIAGL